MKRITNKVSTLKASKYKAKYFSLHSKEEKPDGL
jgi:hypothetical protein